ncbi:hypothetical protein LTR08_007811 [Meristemomyces frigidus]|nr:hypothetical protein LTR08_007811 [Meristemomyces frigidus]
MAASSSSSSAREVLPEDTIHKPIQVAAVREVKVFDRISDDIEYNDDYHGHLRKSTRKVDDDEGFTRHDRIDMKRLGKAQELRRDFRPLSALAFTVILQGTWEVLLSASTQGLVDGGLAGLFWSHWVSEFAPPKYQKLLSYFTGWMSALSWQAGTASGPFLVGTMIQAMIYINDPSYSGTNWQGTLFVWAITLMVYAGNIWGGRGMPVFQNVMLILHVFGFLTIIVMIWVLAPRNSASVVFTQFTNGGGWSSIGLSLMVGQITAIYGKLLMGRTMDPSSRGRA